MIRTCSECHQQNRVDASHLAATGRCGRCKAVLPPLAEPLSVDTKEFRDIVSHAKVPILVDFWASWCGPCRQAAPEVAKVARAMAGRAIVLKVDTDRNQTLAGEFGIQGIPNFVVLNNGAPVKQQAGLVSARQMQSWLEAAV